MSAPSEPNAFVPLQGRLTDNSRPPARCEVSVGIATRFEIKISRNWSPNVAPLSGIASNPSYYLQRLTSGKPTLARRPSYSSLADLTLVSWTSQGCFCVGRELADCRFKES